MEIINEFRVFKDVADAGYKVNTTRLSEFENLNPNASKIIFQSMLIPIFNLMQAFQRAMKYNNIRITILDQFRIMDALEEMSEIEKKEYLKNPTMLNAVIIQLKSELILSEADSVQINNGNKHSEIYYEIDESLNDINILKVSGYASRLTIEEQKKMVADALKINTSIDLNDSENDEKEIEKNPYNIDEKYDISFLIDYLKIKGITQEKLAEEQKQALQRLRIQLLEEQEVLQSTKTDEEQILSKRMK